MRSVFKEEMDLIWEYYANVIKKQGFKDMILTPDRTLMAKFALSYKDLFQSVKEINQGLGKSREEVKYSILKLRRLMALWQKNNIWRVEGGITYAEGDKYEEFPYFASQNPIVIPTLQTIKRMQAKVIHQYIINYNKNYAKNVVKGRSQVVYIKNLRDLKNVLVANERIAPDVANDIIKLYGEAIAKKEVSDFSSESISLI